ncbi:MAG: DUF3473 domain-containing protein [Candidatus Acidulodesulfobacterium acidiphilum]|uniref:DUF3473 domain-containing protein n=1 Tax=Candidatus Acidulodesulfobacterium acidiphilum TaxID=2597224 RepID=A0A520XBZ7_9DELT|nr:MAG: DUF3473 domain-containing protein [Candidatus Acidulodesulfobacterium acidiphilum]
MKLYSIIVMMTNTILNNNVISIDYEDWYHGLTSTSKKFENWNEFEKRIEYSTNLLLNILKAHNITATFFVLGILAKERPDLIRKISAEGHEIGVHTYQHSSVKSLTQKEFEKDIEITIEAISSALPNIKPKGFRAPYFSINNNMLWFYESLAKYDFKYDSSVFPLKTPLYGIKNGERFFYSVNTKYGNILEFPISTFKFYGLRIPMAGGFYFRLMPLNLIKYFINEINKKEKQKVIMYFHPWEFDPSHPYQPKSFREKISHYYGLKNTTQKFNSFLNEIKFSSFESSII